MNFRWLATVSIGSVLFVSSARAESLISRTYDVAVRNYSACADLFDLTEATSGSYALRAKEAKDQAVNCRDRELDRIKSVFVSLRAATNDDPRLLDEVRDFYAYWQSSLKEMSPFPNRTGAFRSEFRVRLEKLRTELSLEW